MKNNSFFVDVMIEKTVPSVKKFKEWNKNMIFNRGLMFLLQRVTTLFNTAPTAVLPVGVSGIISMLNLCDINEKFPNSNTWVHLSSIWLGFFQSVSHLFSLPWFYVLACQCNMEQKFDLFSQNCFNFVEMITCQGCRNVSKICNLVRTSLQSVHTTYLWY